MSTKKIGFIDLYISEWHANNYPAWIKKACEEFGYDYSVARLLALSAAIRSRRSARRVTYL